MTILRKRPTKPGSGSALSLVATNSVLTAVGSAYSQANVATGGTAPYTFAIVAGSPPFGCSLQSTGIVSGVPVNPGGAFTYTVRVTDNKGVTALAVTSGTIVGSVLSLTAAAPSVAQVGAPFSQVNNALGGVPPYTFAKTAGTLVTGTSLNASTGVVSGTVGGVAGAFSYTITVTDNIGATASAASSGTVAAASATIPAASPELSDIVIALNAAATGGTVTVPAGTAIWPRDINNITSLTILKNVSLVGAGDFNGGTLIYTDDNTHPMMQVSAPGSGFMEITGFRFASNGANVQSNGIFRFGGPPGWKNLRVHHNTFDEMPSYIVDVSTTTCAVFDHNRFWGYIGGVHMSGSGTVEWLDTNRAGPSGDRAGWLFIEDNEYHGYANVGGRPCDDLENGGRTVFRHNWSTDFFFQTHDQARTGIAVVGGAQYEVYNNVFTSGGDFWKGVDLAGGTGVVYNNKFTPGAGNIIHHPVGLVDSRSDRTPTTNPALLPGVPSCDGHSSWDGNSGGGQGYLCYQQVGSLGALGAPQSFPIYVWGNTYNGAAWNVTAPDITEEIAVAAGGLGLTSLHVQVGRDVKNETWASYAGAYTYPHPLQAAGTSWGTTYYVDSTLGSNSNSGLNPDVPLASISGMAGNVGGPTIVAGDRVYFHRSRTWTLAGGTQGINLIGGVTYIGDQWPPHDTSQRATFVAGGDMTAGVVFFRDHATFWTRFIGFDVNANSKWSNGISLNHINGATPGPLTGAMKVVRNCIVRNVSSLQASGQFAYGLIVSNHTANGTSGEVANVLIEQTVVHDISRDGLCLYPGDESALDIVRNVTVRQCEVYNCGQDPGYTRGSGIVVKGRVIDSTIEYCYVHDILKGSGIFVNSNETNHYGTGANNVHIRNNVVPGNINQGSIRVFDGGGADARDLHIYGNICHSNTTGPGLYIGDQLLGANSIRVYNNTFYNAPVSVSGAGGATFPVFEFKNNIVVQTNAGIPLTSTSAFTAHSNNLFRSAGATLVSQGGTFTSATLTGWEATALSTDPQFKNAASLPAGFDALGVYGLVPRTNNLGLIPLKPNTDGLSVLTGSPAINSGVNLAAPYNLSVNSVTRTTFDRGAWEA